MRGYGGVTARRHGAGGVSRLVDEVHGETKVRDTNRCGIDDRDKTVIHPHGHHHHYGRHHPHH